MERIDYSSWQRLSLSVANLKLDKMKYASNNVYFSKKMLLFSINWNLYH